MAVNCVIDGNFLVIDDGVKKVYWSSAWISLSFDANYVYLTNDVLPAQVANNNPYQIPLADFEYDSVPIVTEALIFAELKNKIGSSS